MPYFKYYTVVLLSILLPFLSNGQNANQFPDNTEGYLEQLQVFMSKGKNSSLIKSYEDFEQFFNSNEFSETEISKLIEVSNAMLNAKMAASPYFSKLLNTVVYAKSTTNEARFGEWMASLGGQLSGKVDKKVYKKYLDFSLHFFGEKALYFTKSGINWIGDFGNYKIDIKDNQPIFVFDKIDMICRKKKNEIYLKDAKGVLFPNTNRWAGEAATINFDHVNIEGVVAQIKEFAIDLSLGEYKAKTATLIFPEFFPGEQIEGDFEDKVLVENKAIGKTYPRFESNSKKLIFKNISDRISFLGGLRINGENIYAYGSDEEKVKISVFDDYNKAFKKFNGRGKLFKIKKSETIVGEQVETVLYFGRDSLYHPSANFRYNYAKNELNLMKGKKGSGLNPFYDSYHQIMIQSDKLDWFLVNDSMVINQKNISVGNTNQNVTFESLDYFDFNEYNRLQNIASTNPIAVLKIVSEQEGSRTVAADAIAKKINPKFNINSILPLLSSLSDGGFIDYYKDEEKVTIKDKVFLYADAARGKTDYDVIHFVSKSQRTNAVFNLNTNDIKAEDISLIEFSNFQKVAGQPADGRLVVKKDRNISYDGELFAGFGRFAGKGFDFKYHDFKVNMDSIRFFDLFVPGEELDEKGNPVALSIASRIEHVTGSLHIDKEDNKSGKEDIPEYPFFDSADNSFVYYDYEGTQNGAYKRDSFFFELDPFTFKSLDNFTSEALTFKGEMQTANIFPTFKETITLQKDQSLGFIHKVPANGYETYDNKGKYQGQLSMTNEGFFGVGNVKYMQASIDAEDFIFKPDNMLCSADEFQINEDRACENPVPKVAGFEVDIDWKPYKDSMYIVSRNKPFELFVEGSHKLEKTLIFTPNGLKGRGKYDWEKGTLQAELYSFGANSVSTDTAQLKIKAFNTEELALETSNVNVVLDFDKQTGYVKANIDTEMTKLPYNKFETNMNEFEWDIKEEILTFKAPENELGKFYSVDKVQKGLAFEGGSGAYNLKTNELNVGAVPQINVADAIIFPHEGNVEVKVGGVLSRLENAKIIVDTINQHHVINRATIDIENREAYTASGFYEYNIGDKVQEIKFANIKGVAHKKKKDAKTTAQGEVTAEDFYIDAKTKFKGQIELTASSKNLDFDGFAMLDSKFLPKKEWFKIDCKGDKEDLKIAFDTPKNYHGVELKTGLYISKETGAIYPLVMSARQSKSDRVIFETKGIFDFHKKDNAFRFGDSLKIVSHVDRGNTLILSETDGKVNMEGSFEIGSGLDLVNIDVSGISNASMVDDNLEMSCMAGINMNIPEKLLDVMFADLQTSGYDATPVDYTTTPRFYEKALAEIIEDDKQLFKVSNEIRNSGKIQLDKKQQKYDFFLSKVDLKWNSELQSFVSSKDEFCFGSLNNDAIDRKFKGYLEVRMPSNGDDKIYFYLKSPSDYDYLFVYKNGILSISSNSARFLEELEKLKKSEVQQKIDGEIFEIQQVNSTAIKRFLERMKL